MATLAADPFGAMRFVGPSVLQNCYRMRLITKYFIPVVIVTSCSEPPSSTVARTDSAGVEIVHAPALPDRVPELALDSASVVTIGGEEGAVALYRVNEAIALHNGTILVVNSGTSEIRTYTRTGDLVSTTGRKGSGPGEFQALAPGVSLLPGDTVVVFDPRQRRITILSADSSVSVVTPVVPPTTSRVEYIGSWSSVAHLLSHTVRQSAGTTAGIRSDSVVVMIHGGDGEAISRLPTQFSGEQVLIDRGGGAIQIMSRPLGREISVLSVGTHVATVDNISEEVRVYSPDMRLQRIVRRQGSRRPITDADRNELPAGSVPGVELPDSFPSFRRVLSGTDTLIWFERFPSVAGEVHALWEGIDIGGETTARVRVPGDLLVYQIGRDQVIGLDRDTLGVEYVKLFQLISGN